MAPHLFGGEQSIMKNFIFLILFMGISASVYAEDECQEGFLTQYLNSAIASQMKKTDSISASKKIKYSRKLTDYVTPPVFGGYVIGKYGYSSQEDLAISNSFQARMVRMYVSGYLLRDFKYRVQMEFKDTPSMRDYTLEWLRFKEFQVKFGQFKRCFTYENPANPWDIGFGDYSQMTKRFTALASADPSGEPAQNGRDQGLQFSGDLFPVGKDGHRLIRYQLAVYNGSGQNRKENDNKKDWMGNIQIQPVKNLYVALFGWTGSYTANGVTAIRKRWALSAQYNWNDWDFIGEYGHHTGRNLNNYDANTGIWGGPDAADGWYVKVGIPCTPWLKTWIKYDVYREDATWNTARSVFSICPNAQLHKNLKFQLQYNYVHDKTAQDRNYHELWAQAYVRF